MLLRELFEDKSSTTVGIIFGRFNPPHQGHRAAWEMAAENDHWFVGTNQSTEGPKDPLPFKVKVEAMKKIFPEIRGNIVAETSWLTLASKVYKDYGDIILNVYTDEDWVTKTIMQYNGKEGPHGFYKFSNIQQQPTPRLSSATALRDAVIRGDREAFSQAAGIDADTEVAGQPFFDLVAHYLLPYQNAPKKSASKKKAKEQEVEKESRGFTDVSGMSSKEIQKLGHEDDDSGTWTVYVDGKRWKEFNDEKEAYRAAAAIERKYGKKTKVWQESVSEEAAGVGIITKQNSTADVNKGTPRKNLKAFRLV
jgi:nicotinamide mononucleotide adenylyltransferase